MGVELEEARVCLFAMKIALARGYKCIIMEGDRLSIISRVRKKDLPNNKLVSFLSDIIEPCNSFDLIAWVHVNRGCNAVPQAIARIQPFHS